MTDKETIIAEIERLKHYGTIPYDRDMFEGVCLIESFINSLPAEQPSEELEEEIKRKYKYNIGLMMPIESFRKLILHFTQWQKEQMIKSAVSIGYLQDWYQNSIDEEVPPIWTDEHLNELTKDFYLIPKQKEDEQ